MDKFLLGRGNGGNIYLCDFSWDCGWYWGGGYISAVREHSHFSQFYKDYNTRSSCSLYDGFKSRITEPTLTDEQIWRLCDLMKQFYSYKEAAECFHHGGGYTTCDPSEINKDLENTLNEHIRNVIIPHVHALFAEVN